MGAKIVLPQGTITNVSGIRGKLPNAQIVNVQKGLVKLANTQSVAWYEQDPTILSPMPGQIVFQNGKNFDGNIFNTFENPESSISTFFQKVDDYEIPSANYCHLLSGSRLGAPGRTCLYGYMQILPSSLSLSQLSKINIEIKTQAIIEQGQTGTVYIAHDVDKTSNPTISNPMPQGFEILYQASLTNSKKMIQIPANICSELPGALFVIVDLPPSSFYDFAIRRISVEFTDSTVISFKSTISKLLFDSADNKSLSQIWGVSSNRYVAINEYGELVFTIDNTNIVEIFSVPVPVNMRTGSYSWIVKAKVKDIFIPVPFLVGIASNYGTTAGSRIYMNHALYKAMGSPIDLKPWTEGVLQLRATTTTKFTTTARLGIRGQQQSGSPASTLTLCRLWIEYAE